MTSPISSARPGLLRRSVLVALLFFVIIYIGSYLGTRIPQHSTLDSLRTSVQPALPAALLVLGVIAIVFAAAAVLRFVRCGVRLIPQLLRFCSPALFFLFLAALTAQRPIERPPIATSSATLGVVFGSRAAFDTVMVPFFEKTNPEAHSASCDHNQTDFGEASQIANPKVRQAIQHLAKSLAACSEGTDRVRIDVKGYASSSSFENCTQILTDTPGKWTVSEHLNWQLAERRREAVISEIRLFAGPEKIEIEHWDESKPHRWNSPAEMRASPRFKDTNPNGGYDEEAGGLNRRVDIVIKRKATCDPDT